MNIVHHVLPPEFTLLPILVFGFSVVIKEAIAQFALWAGKKISSQALIGDAWHHRSDAVASALIVAGAVFGNSLWWIDSVMGIGVSLLILWAAFDVIRNSANNLLGEVVDPALESRIRTVISDAAPDTTLVHHLHLHRYGQHREITLHLRMAGEATLHHVHEVASRIESKLRSALDVETTIHTEPCGSCPSESDNNTCIATGSIALPMTIRRQPKPVSDDTSATGSGRNW